MQITLLEAAENWLKQHGIKGVRVVQGSNSVWPGQNAIIFKAEPGIESRIMHWAMEDFITDVMITCPGIPICRIETNQGNRFWIEDSEPCAGFCLGGIGLSGERHWSIPPVIYIGKQNA